ncbi:unnamed protein product, partial [Ectocarpus sp. 12 AP-2014]
CYIPKHVGLCVAYSTGVLGDFATGMVKRRGRIGSTRRRTQKARSSLQELETTKFGGPTIR